MDYGAIRSAIAHQLEAFDELVQVHATVPDRVVTPAAAVIPGDPAVEWHTSMTGTTGQTVVARFDVVLFAARFDAPAGQDTLDRLLSTVPAHLEADQTLSGTADVIIVTEATNYGVATVADTAFVAVRLAVEVHTR